MPALPHLSAQDLKNFPAPSFDPPRPACCANLKAPGWESLPPTFEAAQLRAVGTLRSADPAAAEVLAEYHPAGTGFWSPDAPIAPAFFPCNQSELWQCVDCGRPFLRNTEAGGYYHEERIREMRPALVADVPAA